jgi:hypothetical protein
MSLVEGVGGPILPEDCQDQNQKRKFMVLLLHRIAASLVLPQVPSILVSNFPGQTIIWNDDNFMISIAERPRILDGECKLTPSELALVFLWVSINQVVLMVHYGGGTDTCDLNDDLKPLAVPAQEAVWAMEVLRATDEVYKDREIRIPYH